MDTEDGQAFIKHLAHFVRTHEKALANALQLRRQQPKHASSQSVPSSPTAEAVPSASSRTHGSSSVSTSSTLASALSMPYLNFTSQNIKPVKLSLTPHHLFYLLSRFEELDIPVGPMNVRLENLHADTSPANYVSFLSQSQRSKGRGSDRDSIHSVSSVRSVMSGMSSLWSSFGLTSTSSAAKSEKAKAALQADMKYLYSAFTKIPCLRLAPDRKSRLIAGYEEFPFDTAVPLIAFKNVSALEVSDVDFRQIFGWDRLADQLRSLTLKRANLDDPTDLLINIVLDDMDKRRRRSSKSQPSPVLTWAAPSPILPPPETMRSNRSIRSNSAPGSPKSIEKIAQSVSPESATMVRGGSEGSQQHNRPQPRNRSPARPTSSRMSTVQGHMRSGGPKLKRSGSTSSQSSGRSGRVRRSGSSSNVLATLTLPTSKWRFLKHLSLADNSLTSLSASSLAPLADTLHSLDLSANLFAQIPDCLATLTSLRALNLSNCMIDSLHSLSRNPLPAITSLNLRANRLISIAGIQRLLSLERLDLRDNKLVDPTEMARLTGIPGIREIWVANNPFVRTHSNYRVTIFNLFRAAPGFTEDIIIDSTGPGYSERRQLIDRAAEPSNVSVVKPLPVDYGLQTSPEMESSFPPASNGALKAVPPQAPTRTSSLQGEVSVASHRRRKGPRRRIVELSRGDGSPTDRSPSQTNVEVGASPTSQPSHANPDTLSTTPSPRTVPRRPEPPRAVSMQPQNRPRIDTSMGPPPVPPKNNDPPKILRTTSETTPDWNVSSDIYRKKIEALREEVGNGWLSVLSEEGWDHQRRVSATATKEHGGGDFSPASTIRPSPTTPRAVSQGVVGGARTLG
ncbi:MAG: hypothetical protein M1817_001521 [Caeruleum heppii]|nr:MAG: hypothetical protein M1817_001521 [Caeruleum heppii]